MNKDYKILIIVLVLAAVAVGIYFIVKAVQKKKDDKGGKENFGMIPSRKIKLDKIGASSMNAVEKGNIYSIPGTYQSQLSPRFSNVGYNAYIRYNLPETKNLAVPTDPLSQSNLVEEFINKVDVSPATQNYYDAVQKVQEEAEGAQPVSHLPVSDMTSISEDAQPIVYDRFMYANRNTRLRAQGDQIRGDLPIVPCQESWFRPSVQPHIDLQTGAMNVLAGPNNEQSKAMATLVAMSTAGTETIVGGVDLATHYNTTLSAGQSDVTVAAYP